LSLALVSKQGFVGADDGRRRKTIGESRHFGRIIISLNVICVLHIAHHDVAVSVHVREACMQANIICAAHHDVAVSVWSLSVHVRVHASRAYHS
jgi:hypothetical protein